MKTVLHTPEPITPENFDLCDHWIDRTDSRCQNYWRTEIVLEEPVDVGGETMNGRYSAGHWRFCRTHMRIFNRDRKDKSGQ